MPIYEYRCQNCERSFEALVTRGDPQAQCPQCGGQELIRELSTFASGGGNGGSGEASAVPMGRACCGGGCGCG